MNAHRLKPLRFPWPPVFYAAGIALAFILGHIICLSPADANELIFVVAGAILVVGAILLDVWALATLMRQHTTIMPHKRATRLVTDGPYAWTRNPSYVAYTMITIGIGLITANPWFLIAAVTAAFVTTSMAIRCEEMHLLARFGIDFERYCATTRRWI